MRYLLAMCALCHGAVAGGPPVAADSSLTVLLIGTRVPTAVLQAMEHEAEAAIPGSMVKLNWKFREDLSESAVSGPMALIDMRGQCNADARLAPTFTSDGTPLGMTHISNGQVLPIADVLCDPIRGLVGRDLGGRSATERDYLFGRALGRVLAHELYHIVLRSVCHGHQGLSRASQSSAQLLSPRGGFGWSDEHRIAESLGSAR